jgi:hypothetical protein
MYKVAPPHNASTPLLSGDPTSGAEGEERSKDFSPHSSFYNPIKTPQLFV